MPKNNVLVRTFPSPSCLLLLLPARASCRRTEGGGGGLGNTNNTPLAQFKNNTLGGNPSNNPHIYCYASHIENTKPQHW